MKSSLVQRFFGIMDTKSITLEGKDESIKWLEFDLLKEFPNLFHASLLRHGGNSSRNFKSLNLSYDVGDNEEDVKANFELVTKAFDIKKISYAKQVHGINIVRVDQKSPTEIPDCDALMTNTPNVTLMTRHADCQIAILYDPINHAIANVHAGWRGNAQNIYEKTVEAMKIFGSKPENLLACISPSLGPDAAKFENLDELPPYFADFQIKPNHIDLWAIAEKQLLDSGLLKNHIEIARICTYNNPEDFFSFRRDKITGRHATIIELRSS